MEREDRYDDEFSGSVVLVTGAGGACIGGPTSLRFAQLGASIVCCDVHGRRNAQWARRIRDETGAATLEFELDIADRPAVDEMIAETARMLGAVDVLVCNATENKLGHMVSYDPADWDRTIDVALTANFYLARSVLPAMVEKRRGAIVNIASVAAWIGNPNEAEGEPAYASAKAALLALTRNIAAEVGRHNVRCNAVAPGLIRSRFVEKYAEQFIPMIDETPMRRWGEPEDVVEAIVFLASDRRAGFVTGETLNVSGGWYMRP